MTRRGAAGTRRQGACADLSRRGENFTAAIPGRRPGRADAGELGQILLGVGALRLIGIAVGTGLTSHGEASALHLRAAAAGGRERLRRPSGGQRRRALSTGDGRRGRPGSRLSWELIEGRGAGKTTSATTHQHGARRAAPADRGSLFAGEPRRAVDAELGRAGAVATWAPSPACCCRRDGRVRHRGYRGRPRPRRRCCAPTVAPAGEAAGRGRPERGHGLLAAEVAGLRVGQHAAVREHDDTVGECAAPRPCSAW